MKLPLRFKILYILHKSGGKPLTTKEIYEGLVSDYQGEGQFNLESMEQHFLSLKATAIIEGCEAYIDETGEARYKYCLTEEGRKRIKYLPPAYQT